MTRLFFMLNNVIPKQEAFTAFKTGKEPINFLRSHAYILRVGKALSLMQLNSGRRKSDLSLSSKAWVGYTMAI